MRLTRRVRRILDGYESEPPGVRGNLARILMHGRLAGTGRMVVLPVDQGFEHGPARSFAPNPAGYDPHYHFRLAIDAGVNAFAAPLGLLAAGAASFAGAVPMILKLNSSNSLSLVKDQAVTGSIEDALHLGCAAVGFTIYPGSEQQFPMMEEIRDCARRAKSHGLAVVIWSYPRGGALSKAGETAIDITAYAAHMAALLGAHIIKVKPPSAHIEQEAARPMYEKIATGSLAERVAHIMDSAFARRRLVVFSGGAAKGDAEIFKEVKAIAQGGASGSIIGRNSFQRPKEQALEMLSKIMDIYRRQM